MFKAGFCGSASTDYHTREIFQRPYSKRVPLVFYSIYTSRCEVYNHIEDRLCACIPIYFIYQYKAHMLY